MPRPDPHPAGVQQALRERLDQGRTGAPGDVEAGHRIAVTRCGVAASFGPLDERKPPDAQIVQPAPLLPGREVHVRLGPAARPVILRPVEACTAQPVGQGQLLGVVDPQPSLLGGVDQEQPTEGPVRLPAERTQGLGVDDDHRVPGLGHLVPGHQPRQARTDHDHVRVHDVDAAMADRPGNGPAEFRRLCALSLSKGPRSTLRQAQGTWGREATSLTAMTAPDLERLSGLLSATGPTTEVRSPLSRQDHRDGAHFDRRRHRPGRIDRPPGAAGLGGHVHRRAIQAAAGLS